MDESRKLAAAQTFVQETQAFVDKGVLGVTIVDSEQVKSLVIKSLPAGNGNCFAAALILSLVFLGINISKYH